MRSFRGRVAVVTGAAGGIGRAVATALADRGCHLALTDLREHALREAESSLARPGRNVTTHALDVTVPSALERLHDEVLQAHGAAHILVNNAGITIYGLFEEMPREEVKRLLDINLWGVMDGCRIFLPTLRQQEEAHIVNVSSMAAMTGMPFQAAYCASKAAVRGFSEALRAELSTSNVGVTTVLPGAVRTPMLSRAPTHDAHITKQLAELMQRFGYPPDRLAERLVDAIAADRDQLVLTPESVATHAMARLAPRALRGSMSGLFRLAAWFGATEREAPR